jgi:capsular exopolysaccharide synthesis family protein
MRANDKTDTGQPTESEGSQYGAFDVEALWALVRRKASLIAGCAIAGLVLGIVYAVSQPPAFEAIATVQVEEQNSSVVAIQEVTKEDFKQPEDLKTVEQQLLSRNLIWRVIKANKLDQTPGFFKPGLLARIQGRPLSQGDMIDSLLRSFSVKLRRGSRLIDITVRRSDPRMAQTLASSLIHEAVSRDAEWRANPSREANSALVEEAARLKQKVESAEQALQDYREKNQAVSLDDKQNIIVERLKDLNMRAAQAQNDTAALESDLAQLEKTRHAPDKLLAIGSIANAQSVLDAQRSYTQKEGAFAVLKQRYGPENPAYAQAERELHLVRAALDAAVLNAADSLRAKYESAKFTQQTSEKRLQEQEQLALDLNRKATHYGALAREVETDRALFESVVKRLKEMSVIQNINQVHLRVVDPPMLPDVPGLRSKLLLVVLGMFGGGAMGFGVVLGLFVAKPSIQSPGHAGRVLGIPALGLIPRMRRLKDISHIPAIAAPRSQTAEAFRFVAASMSSILGPGGKGSLVLTGVTSDDGTTSCAAAYAVAAARSGVRTLLVDANLRDPAIGPLFSIPKNASGLADCLAGRVTLEEAVQPTKVENLFVLAAGSAPPDISALFAGPAFGEFISKAAGEFGQVIIDSAPVNTASESLLVARHASAVCIVVQNGRTPVSAASRACELLEGVDRTPAGFILCRVPRRMLV